MAERIALPLAWRLLRRQWRAGDLLLMAAAGLLAVALATLLAAFGDRLDQAMGKRAAELLGADLVLTCSQPPRADLLAGAQAQGHTLARALDFSTMALAGEQLVLVAVRAVDDSYPLRGELRTRPDLPAAGTDPVAGSARAAQGPRPGELWLEPRAAEELGVAVGATVGIGNATLRVSALVAAEPDRATDFSALSPRALMHLDDVAASGVVQPGSRVRYRTLFAGTPGALATLQAQLEQARAPHEEVLDVREGSRRTAAALGRTRQFLALAGLLGLLLCGTAIALAADRQARRLYDTVALLRTLGLSRQAVWQMLALQQLLLAAAVAVPGAVAGYLLQEVLAGLLGGLLPSALPPPTLAALAGGAAVAFIALPAFALPPLTRLSTVSPLRVLRRDLDPPGQRTLLLYLLGGSALLALLLASASDRTLALGLLAGVAALALLAVPVTLAAASLLRRLRPYQGLAVRLASDRLLQSRARFGAQLVAFALILATMALTALLRDDLFASWQRQLPADAPNLFALNVFPHEQEAFAAALARAGVATPPLYPMTPGRLLRINDQPARDRVAGGSGAERALERDLNLTQGSTLGADNSVSAGTFFTAASPPGEVSVEEKLAGELGLALGDRLLFSIAGMEVGVTVTSLRKVDWDSFQPNFYMVFSPGTLADTPYTLLASFHADDPRRLMRALRTEFPAVTLIEVGPLLERMNAFVGELALGIEFLLALLLAAATLLLVASVVTRLDERLGEAALLRVLGARRALLRRTLLAEFGLLGLLAGVLAAATTETARWQLYTRALELDWAPLPLLWLLLPPLAAVLLAACGYAAARRSLDTDAQVVLREAAA